MPKDMIGTIHWAGTCYHRPAILLSHSGGAAIWEYVGGRWSKRCGFVGDKGQGLADAREWLGIDRPDWGKTSVERADDAVRSLERTLESKADG